MKPDRKRRSGTAGGRAAADPQIIGSRTSGVPGKELVAALAKLSRAEARTRQAEALVAIARTRAEQAETRAGEAESRTEQAKTRTEHAETYAEFMETRLEQMLELEARPGPNAGFPFNPGVPVPVVEAERSMVGQLPIRQREVLHLIAEGRNTKQIAQLLKLSPKTVEYHRSRLMSRLGVHDVSGLVRFALRTGLISGDL